MMRQPITVGRQHGPQRSSRTFPAIGTAVTPGTRPKPLGDHNGNSHKKYYVNYLGNFVGVDSHRNKG